MCTELGINFEHIYSKTRSVLWPQRSKLNQEVIYDADFAGPMIFCFLLGVLLLFVRAIAPAAKLVKLHKLDSPLLSNSLTPIHPASHTQRATPSQPAST